MFEASRKEDPSDDRQSALQVQVMACNWQLKQMHSLPATAERARIIQQAEEEKKRILDSEEGKELNGELTFDDAGRFLLETFETKIGEIKGQLEKVAVGSQEHTHLTAHLREITNDRNELQHDMKLFT